MPRFGEVHLARVRDRDLAAGDVEHHPFALARHRHSIRRRRAFSARSPPEMLDDALAYWRIYTPPLPNRRVSRGGKGARHASSLARRMHASDHHGVFREATMPERRHWSAPPRTSARAKRRAPRPRDSSAKRSSTFARANTVRDRRSKRLRSACRGAPSGRQATPAQKRGRVRTDAQECCTRDRSRQAPDQARVAYAIARHGQGAEARRTSGGVEDRAREAGARGSATPHGERSFGRGKRAARTKGPMARSAAARKAARTRARRR